MINQTIDKTKIRNQLVWLIVAILALYIIIPQIGGFQDSFDVIKQANLSELIIAIGFSLATFFAAAGTYFVLSLRPIKYFRTVVAQMAAMFVNRLLPAGIGGMGANYVYLRKAGHTLPQAASVVAVNNLIGFVGHIALTSALLIAFRDQLPSFSSEKLLNNGLFIVASFVISCVYCVCYQSLQSHPNVTIITVDNLDVHLARA